MKLKYIIMHFLIYPSSLIVGINNIVYERTWLGDMTIYWNELHPLLHTK